MSQKGSTDEPGGGSSTTTARRRRELASGFRFTADLTRSINQAFSPPTNTVMQAFRDLQRSLVQPLLPKIEAAVRLSPSVIELAALKPAIPQYDLSPSVIELAALKPAIPQYDLSPSVIELAALKPAIPQYNLGQSVIELASRKAVLPPYVLPRMTNFIADQALLAQRMMTPWLTEIGATLTDEIVSHWRVPLTHALDGLFREWSWIASFGADLARRAAQAGLFAAMRAKAALLEGRLEAVDDFIMNWLGLRPTKRRHDAVTLVLLEGQWIPADPETDAHLVLTQIRDLAAKEARAAKSIAETRLRGSRVTLLATHDEKLADPATVEGLPIRRGGFDNPRLDQVLARLEPVEQRVAYSYGEGGSGLTWEDAAILEGLPAAFGETVRRKLKRARDEIGRRAAMAPPSEIRQQTERR